MAVKVRTSRIPAWFGAQAMAVSPSLILVLPARVGDRALIEHEKEHTRQQEACGWLRWWLAYLCSREFRMEAEIAAYQVQMAHGASLSACARNLSTLYRLRITYEQAVLLLTH